MKKLSLAIVSLVAFASSLSASAAPQYTLQQICTKFGKFNQCQTVPFCQVVTTSSGCYLNAGEPSYIAGLCTIQKEEQYCTLNPKCHWEQATVACQATTDSL